MAQTKKILTSLHGKKFGIAHDGKLVADGFTVPRVNDSGSVFGVQATPGTLNTTGTLTAALILGGIVTSTTGAAVVATLDTGTAMDTAIGAYMNVDDCFDWTAYASGANSFTVTASSGHTIVGSGVVATTASASFRTRKTAANTYVTYRK